MKVVIDTTMGRHMLEATSDDALALTQSIMEKYAEKNAFSDDMGRKQKQNDDTKEKRDHGNACLSG